MTRRVFTGSIASSQRHSRASNSSVTSSAFICVLNRHSPELPTTVYPQTPPKWCLSLNTPRLAAGVSYGSGIS